MSQKPAGIGRTEITKYMHDNYGNKPINLIYCSWTNPYNSWHKVPIKFYIEDNMIDKRIKNICELNDSLIKKGAINLLVVRKINSKNKICVKQIKQNNFIF